MLRIVQLSDTHFGPDGHRSHGGFGYDTDAAFEAVAAHIAEGEPPDAIVVTGDIADRGLPEEYDKARAALSRLPVAVNTTPGNHDFHLPFEVGLAHSGPGVPITMARLQRHGPWLFVFADSNATGRQSGPGGRLVDRETRMHDANGAFGPGELSWLIDVVAATDADHVFIWTHHPPAVPVGQFHQPAFDAEVAELFASDDRIRGLGAGHVHTDVVREVAGRPIYVCPAFTINIDFENETLLPPGYRRYTFDDDGTVTSETQLMDGDTWPRTHLPPVVMAFLRGEIGWDELMAGLEDAGVT